MHFTNEPKRIYYAFAFVISIVLGLASRYFKTLPDFIANHAGDTFWAMMVYFLFRFIFVRKSQRTSLFLSFTFCFFIEFTQLYQADWINSIRITLLGGLILGKGFLIVDLIRYCTGIVIAYMTDKWIAVLNNWATHERL